MLFCDVTRLSVARSSGAVRLVVWSNHSLSVADSHGEIWLCKKKCATTLPEALADG
jgi:hypothetical protein